MASLFHLSILLNPRLFTRGLLKYAEKLEFQCGKKKIDKSPGLLPFSCLWRLQHPVIHYRWPTSQVALQRRPHHWSDWLKFLLTKLCTNGECVKTCEAPGKRTMFSFIYKRVRGKKSADKDSDIMFYSIGNP